MNLFSGLSLLSLGFGASGARFTSSTSVFCYVGTGYYIMRGNMFVGCILNGIITITRNKFDLFIFWWIVSSEHQFVIFRCCKFCFGFSEVLGDLSERHVFITMHMLSWLCTTSRLLRIPIRFTKEVMRADYLWWTGWSCRVYKCIVNTVLRLRDVNLEIRFTLSRK
jgi:hypothetical protein